MDKTNISTNPNYRAIELKRLTKEVIVSALRSLAEKGAQLRDRSRSVYGGYVKVDTPLSVSDEGLLLLKGKPFHKICGFGNLSLWLPGVAFESKAGMSADTTSVEFLAELDNFNNKSKSQSKHIHRVISQFERTNSLESARNVLRLIPNAKLKERYQRIEEGCPLYEVVECAERLERLTLKKTIRTLVSQIASEERSLEVKKQLLDQTFAKLKFGLNNEPKSPMPDIDYDINDSNESVNQKHGKKKSSLK